MPERELQTDPQNDLFTLQSKIISLERENAALLAENAHLKELLINAGIAVTAVPESFDPNQGARIIFPDTITTHMANRFFSYFWGRQDVYAKRSIKKETGAASYYPQCSNFWRHGCHRRSRDKVPCKECQMREYKRLTIEDTSMPTISSPGCKTGYAGLRPSKISYSIKPRFP